MNSIEKELAEVTKLSHKEGESRGDFLQKMQAKVDGLPPEKWETLSEETQKWSNAASVAVDNKQDIPDFDGTIPAEDEAKDKDGGEADGGEAAGGKEENVKKPAAKKPATKKAPAKKAAAPKTAKTAAKKAAPAKAEKGKANGAKRGRKGAFDDTSKITKVAGENPFRDGSKASDCFKQYKVGRTVKQVLDAGVPRSKLARHANKGHVTIG